MSAGVVVLRPIGGKIACPVEVHVEDGETWQGYNLSNPFAGYRTYRKDRYEVVNDERAS